MSSFLVKIEHTVEEIEVILLALAERPFKEVAGLIQKLHTEASRKVAEANAEAAASTAEPQA
jgi:hypothetical protein